MLKKGQINRPTLIKLLTEEEFVEITFRKSTTGTVRVMACTLRLDKIQPIYHKSVEFTLKSQETSILPVWDIIKGGWRSFKIPTVIQVQPASHMGRIEQIAARVGRKNWQGKEIKNR